jgi:hypothetical protein
MKTPQDDHLEFRNKSRNGSKETDTSALSQLSIMTGFKIHAAPKSPSKSAPQAQAAIYTLVVNFTAPIAFFKPS